MKQNKLLILVALICICFVAGCNLFSFTNPVDSATDYIAEGQRKYWDRDYEGAVSDFTKAKEADPENGLAYWWHAKALLRTTGFTAISLVTSLSDLEREIYTIVPFMDWSADSANTLYQALFGVNDDLRMIYYDSVFSEELNYDSANLDFAAFLAIFGVLMLRDTNVDSVINSDDVVFNAYFFNDEFHIPSFLWDIHPDVHRINLINQIEVILVLFQEVVTLIAETEGINIQELEELIDEMLLELRRLRDEIGGGLS